MSRFLDPYYLVNSLLLLVYGGLRAYFTYLTPEGSKHSRFQSMQDLAGWVRGCCAVDHRSYMCARQPLAIAAAHAAQHVVLLQ
jgi:hypothetical protein